LTGRTLGPSDPAWVPKLRPERGSSEDSKPPDIEILEEANLAGQRSCPDNLQESLRFANQGGESRDSLISETTGA